MDKIIRKPFEGIGNVVRFNWHFYVLALASILIISLSLLFVPDPLKIYGYILAAVIISTTSFSLLATYYIYDCSPIYTLDCLDELNISSEDSIVNIHSGFDEFSFIIAQKYNPKDFRVFDFYNPEKHTEISIERARKVSAVFPDTKSVDAASLPLAPQSVDHIFVLFSAHEIRNSEERILFFQQMEKALKDKGQLIVIEHLRDVPNFIAYTIGFFHFFPKSAWKRTFCTSHLSIKKEIKITPFVSAFILQKNGITS